jgi:hypothetical protein
VPDPLQFDFYLDDAVGGAAGKSMYVAETAPPYRGYVVAVRMVNRARLNTAVLDFQLHPDICRLGCALDAAINDLHQM